MLYTYLTPEQRALPKFAIDERYINGPQSSWMNHMVRKNMGSANVWRYIFKHGIPNIMTLPPHTKVLTKETLKQMIEQLLTWYASILYSIVEYENDPRMELAHKTSALEETEWRSRQRSERETARTYMERGEKLNMDVQSRKRHFSQISVEEQQILKDYRTGKAAKIFHDLQKPGAHSLETKVLYMPEY